MHAQFVKAGLGTDVVIATALVNMFAKCGSLQDAQHIFDKMKVHNVISWTAMINAYSEHNMYVEAVNVFHQMQQEGMEPDPVLFICLCKPCADEASLQGARLLHGNIVATSLESDIRVRNGLIDMYVKCGSVMDAHNIFNRMLKRDLVTWSAMLASLGQPSHGGEALELFHQMVSEGIRPDSVTFVPVLSAHNNGGLVDKGLWYFHHMSKDHRIALTIEHLNCRIDLLEGSVGEPCAGYKLFGMHYTSFFRATMCHMLVLTR